MRETTEIIDSETNEHVIRKYREDGAEYCVEHNMPDGKEIGEIINKETREVKFTKYYPSGVVHKIEYTKESRLHRIGGPALVINWPNGSPERIEFWQDYVLLAGTSYHKNGKVRINTKRTGDGIVANYYDENGRQTQTSVWNKDWVPLGNTYF